MARLEDFLSEKPLESKISKKGTLDSQKAFQPLPSKRQTRRAKTLSSIAEFLNPAETVIWKCKPAKKTILLQSLAGIWFALFFGAFASIMLCTGAPLLGLPLALLVVAGCLITAPPIWFMKKLPNTEYALTNQRLLIKTGPTKHNIWQTDLGKIKGFTVKTGVSDKLLGTGKLYPITAEYPYAPKARVYTRRGMDTPRRVFNLSTGTYDEISETELYLKSISHPHLEGIREPYAAKKLFTETIGAEANMREIPLQYSNLQKLGLTLGAALISAGLLVFAWGYVTSYTPYVSYTDGYTYIDYVALTSIGLIFPAAIVLALTIWSILKIRWGIGRNPHGWHA